MVIFVNSEFQEDHQIHQNDQFLPNSPKSLNSPESPELSYSQKITLIKNQYIHKHFNIPHITVVTIITIFIKITRITRFTRILRYTRITIFTRITKFVVVTMMTRFFKIIRPECDIRMDFDTNEYTNIFVSRK